MNKFVNLVTKHKITVITLFLFTTIVSLVLLLFVKVNYNMVDYLPPDAQSTKALTIMNQEFTQSMPNTKVMVKEVSLMEAVEYKHKLASLDGVSEVLWLDDVIDIKQPLEMEDPETVEGFYKDGNALFTVTITKGMEKETTAAIRDVIGDDNALTGDAPYLANAQQAAASEVLKAMAILIPVIIVILILTTSSWIEPVLFLAAIGVSILINMGTNLIFGEISFLTYSVSPILQLAVSLDYAIFLLHSFADYRKKYKDVDEAMRQSMKSSMSTIAASAATTLVGFLALTFMNFRIGADLGLNLVKGIIFSFISVTVFLPALTLCLYRLLDKTRHRELTPAFKNVNRILSKVAIPVVFLVAIMIVPCFLGQRQTTFTYGNASADPTSRIGQDGLAIEEEFGRSTIMVLLVPRGDVVKESMLCNEIEKLPHVTSVMSYASNVGMAIPPAFLDKDITEQFYSDHYTRIVIYTDTPEEGALAFETVDTINKIAKSHYEDEVYSVGQSANLFDMKQVVQEDNTMINFIAVIGILIVLLITFKSAILPFILLLSIEAGIWINLSIPYFAGSSIAFIGYLVISTVQLGATVDYAILLTSHYMRNRRLMSHHEAVAICLGDTFKSILVSATTLAMAGFALSITASNPVVSDLGMLLARGTILSVLMVVGFLPTMLTTFDKLIAKTTYKSGFYSTKKVSKHRQEDHYEVEGI